jgi:hypothetical protein
VPHRLRLLSGCSSTAIDAAPICSQGLGLVCGEHVEQREEAHQEEILAAVPEPELLADQLAESPPRDRGYHQLEGTIAAVLGQDDHRGPGAQPTLTEEVIARQTVRIGLRKPNAAEFR